MSLKHKRGKRINYNYKVYNGYFYSLKFVCTKMLMFTVFYLKNQLTTKKIDNFQKNYSQILFGSLCLDLTELDLILKNV